MCHSSKLHIVWFCLKKEKTTVTSCQGWAFCGFPSRSGTHLFVCEAVFFFTELKVLWYREVVILESTWTIIEMSSVSLSGPLLNGYGLWHNGFLTSIWGRTWVKTSFLGMKLLGACIVRPRPHWVVQSFLLLTFDNTTDRALDKHRPICPKTLEAGESNVRIFGPRYILKRTNSTPKTERGWGPSMSTYHHHTGSKGDGGNMRKEMDIYWGSLFSLGAHGTCLLFGSSSGYFITLLPEPSSWVTGLIMSHKWAHALWLPLSNGDPRNLYLVFFTARVTGWFHPSPGVSASTWWWWLRALCLF